jgi:DnaJ-class molecular chaperone
MGAKNYYIVLGVPRTENSSGIRTAFRQLAKRYHPDRAGAGEAARFREIAEAYETLSDPERRRLYNHTLDEAERPATPVAEPLSSRTVWPNPEPLVREPRSLSGDYGSIGPSFGELYEGFARNFTGLGVPKGKRLEAIDVEVLLSAEEALRGVVVPIAVPVLRRCQICGGSGKDWLFPCFRCGQRGFFEREETIEIELPPFLRSGTIVDVSLHDLGIRNFVLRVHVQIGRA